MNSSVGDLFGGASRRVRDDVWGDIHLSRAVRALLETKAMRRLKDMRQLSFSSQAFPNARHSRLDHALGVYHLTTQVLARISDSGAHLEEREVQATLAAALLLNVGAYPNSESIESIALPGLVGRKELNRRWIEQSDVARVLREEWDVEPHNVFRIVTRDNELPIALTPTEHLARDILFGALDLDTLDSLPRDARGADVDFDLVKIPALLEQLRVVGQENRAILSIDEEGAGMFQALVFSKYLMNYNVYGHPSLRIPTTMFMRAVQDAVQDEAITFDKLSEQDDDGAFRIVRESAQDGSSTSALSRRLADRRPYLRALEIDSRHHSYTYLLRLKTDSSWRRRVEEAWARYLTRYRKGEAKTYEILIDIPEDIPPDVDLRYIRRTPLPGERNLTDWYGLSAMNTEDMANYATPLHRIRVIAANKDLTQSVRRHAEELFTIAKEVG